MIEPRRTRTPDGYDGIARYFSHRALHRANWSLALVVVSLLCNAFLTAVYLGWIR